MSINSFKFFEFLEKFLSRKEVFNFVWISKAMVSFLISMLLAITQVSYALCKTSRVVSRFLKDLIFMKISRLCTVRTNPLLGEYSINLEIFEVTSVRKLNFGMVVRTYIAIQHAITIAR